MALDVMGGLVAHDKAISSAFRASAISATVKAMTGRPAASSVWKAFGGRLASSATPIWKSQLARGAWARQARSITGSIRLRTATKVSTARSGDRRGLAYRRGRKAHRARCLGRGRRAPGKGKRAQKDRKAGFHALLPHAGSARLSAAQHSPEPPPPEGPPRPLTQPCRALPAPGERTH
ncbi:MAG: hypothetical protein R3D61_14010 [Defluviimonas denitrificans]